MTKTNSKTWSMQIIKFVWCQFFILWQLQNKTVCGNKKDDFPLNQQEFLLEKVEALYLLKDKVLARDKALMFQSHNDAIEFVDKYKPMYIEQWLAVWQPYFKRGVDTVTARTTANTKLINSYLKRKTSSIQARAHLPHGCQTMHDAIDNDCPIGGTLQQTLHK
eukprot:14126674-Ditylum_brightwellii.AAC.1